MKNRVAVIILELVPKQNWKQLKITEKTVISMQNIVNQMEFVITSVFHSSMASLIHHFDGTTITHSAECPHALILISILIVQYISLFRALNPDYADGLSEPRESHTANKLPSARNVSLSVHRPSYSIDPEFTVMVAVFGQFLDHDITATALNQGQDNEPIDCCAETGDRHPECFPVILGAGDPNFDLYNITCMNFVRSAPAPTDRFGPRQQLNQASAYIDGSVVYGYTGEKVESLRTREFNSKTV